MRTEKVLAAIAVIGFIFKLLLWKGGALLLLISLTLLGLLYMFFAFYFFADKSIKKQNLGISIISGFLLSFLPLGILFRLLHWKGGQELLLFGIPAAIFLLLLLLIAKKKEPELRNFYNYLVKRTIVLILLAGLLFFTSPVTLYEIMYSREPELARLMIQDYLHPGNPAYRDSIDHYYQKEYSQ